MWEQATAKLWECWPSFYNKYMPPISARNNWQAAILPYITYLEEPAENTSVATGTVNLVRCRRPCIGFPLKISTAKCGEWPRPGQFLQPGPMISCR